MKLSVRERIERKTVRDSETGCWIWQGYRDASGYGRMGIGKRTSVLVHRAAWEVYGHPAVQAGFELHHVCENRPCCNPSHLQCVTKRAHRIELSPNALAFRAAHRTHCPYGHPYSGDNLIIPKGKPNARECRTCANRRVKEFYQRNPEKYRAHVRYGIELRRQKGTRNRHKVDSQV